MNKTFNFFRLAGFFLFAAWSGMVSAVDQPDLTVSGITWTPASPVVGNAVTFSAACQEPGDRFNSGEHNCQRGF